MAPPAALAAAIIVAVLVALVGAVIVVYDTKDGNKGGGASVAMSVTTAQQPAAESQPKPKPPPALKLKPALKPLKPLKPLNKPALKPLKPTTPKPLNKPTPKQTTPKPLNKPTPKPPTPKPTPKVKPEDRRPLPDDDDDNNDDDAKPTDKNTPEGRYDGPQLPTKITQQPPKISPPSTTTTTTTSMTTMGVSDAAPPTQKSTVSQSLFAAGQPEFMTGFKPIAARAKTKAAVTLDPRRPPLVVVNLCRMRDAGTSGDWAVVQKRAAGYWMNTADTPNYAQVMSKFSNRVAYYEFTPHVLKNNLYGTLDEVNRQGGRVGGAAWYFGDENRPANQHWRENTMDLVRALTSGITDCVTVMCGRDEWQTGGTGQQWMGKPGPPRDDVGGGAYQASRCCGVCFEMSFEAWDNTEMIRAMEWCRANRKLFIMLAHTDKQDYIGSIKKAVAGMKARGLWPDIIVPSNYNSRGIILPAVPEGRGADYPNTIFGAARYLIEAWD
jgi:hypothetical protein